ncbi:sensor domain-containing diguanylate cyclase [Paucibacter soli]|uniref:sensor domain-containing diguanylate cyclase n=1 Tax=Paucibacter soli TaxID=3133433 RepID=UPI0030ADE3CF
MKRRRGRHPEDSAWRVFAVWLAGTGLVAVLLTAVFMLVADDARLRRDKEAAAQALSATRIAAARLDGATDIARAWLDELERLIDPAELARPELPSEQRLQQLDRWIDQIKRLNPSIGNLGYLDAQGRAYLLRGLKRSNVSLAGTDYWRELLRLGAQGRGKVQVSSVYRFKTTGKLGFVQARGIYADDGRLLGAVVLGLHVEYLEQAIKEVWPGGQGFVVLADQGLRLIARVPAVEGAQQRQLARPQVPGPLPNTWRVRSEFDGGARLVAISPLKHAPMQVAVGIAEADYQGELQQARRQFGLALLTLWMVSALAIWWALRFARSRAQALRAQQLLRDALAMSPVPGLLAGGAGLAVTEINEAALAMLALERAQIEGRGLAACFVQPEALTALLAKADADSAVQAGELELRRGESSFWATVQVRAVPDPRQAQRASYLMSLIDVNERRVREEGLRLAASTDALTGLANRREFFEVARSTLPTYNRRRQAVVVLMLDIDHFKQINDRHGHAGGDQVLRALGALLQQQMRKPDLAARLGGEEFACLLVGADEQMGSLVAQRLLKAIHATEVTLTSGQRLRFTASMGLSAVRFGDADIEAALARADAALYRAKAGGRDRIELAPRS